MRILLCCLFCFFKQKTAYEMRISDWSSDVCSSDLQAKAGLEAVYLSGWQVAADGNTSETMYPDQSLYAYDSVPTMVRCINNTLKRADEIQWSRGVEPGRSEARRVGKACVSTCRSRWLQ